MAVKIFGLRSWMVLGFLSLGVLLNFSFSKTALADETELNRYKAKFKNFITCELTRTSAVNHFKGQPFKITMINVFEVTAESDLLIITGAVQCFVKDRHQMLYAAVGVEKILNTEQLSYYTVRKKDFSILATELFKYPYKERCPWSEYWVDTD